MAQFLGVFPVGRPPDFALSGVGWTFGRFWNPMYFRPEWRFGGGEHPGQFMTHWLFRKKDSDQP